MKAAVVVLAALLVGIAAPTPALAAAEAGERGVFQRWIGTVIVGAFILGIVVAGGITWWRNRRDRRGEKA